MIPMYQIVTQTFKKSVINMGIKLSTRLPLELRKLEGFKEFKHKLKFFLLHHSFYTLHEFPLEGW
jgi:hypothetical protein